MAMNVTPYFWWKSEIIQSVDDKKAAKSREEPVFV